jgi:cyclopropane fatty-acyl-phospholipid synthase-like methyltransferase
MWSAFGQLTKSRSTYDAEWLLSLDMGPNPLWLLEDLLADLRVRHGAKVLDLGSGRGATSVFLAREFGAEVWAVDLWTKQEVAEAVFAEAGVQDAVHAINADARSLPFGDHEFDVIISVDAWEYFGTDDRFLPGLLRVLKPEGQIGVATPSMKKDVRDLGETPSHISNAVGWEALAWHSPARWEQQWKLTGLVENVTARLQNAGCKDWLRWSRALQASGRCGEEPASRMLEEDAGNLLSFVLISATKI